MRIFIILILLTIVFPLSAANPNLADDDVQQKPDHQHPEISEDLSSVILDDKSQQLMAIKTQVLEAVFQQSEYTAHGIVLSLEPLLQFRQQYLAAQAQKDAAKARYTEAHLNLARTETLHHQDIVSTRRLQEQQAQWQTDKAGLDASGNQQKTILDSCRLEWGNILTDWFVLLQNKTAEPFFRQQAQLLQITLPVNQHLEPGVRTAYIDERGLRQTAIKAELIAASPKIDPVSQGERYFFKSSGRPLAFGSHLTVWLPDNAQPVKGVSIPKSAVVWHLGLAQVFVKSADHFTPRTLQQYSTEQHGYFVSDSLKPGEEIVTTGAQTLLSQQLKAQIPDEDKE